MDVNVLVNNCPIVFELYKTIKSIFFNMRVDVNISASLYIIMVCLYIVSAHAAALAN